MSKSKAQHIGQCRICGLQIYKTHNNNRYVGHSNHCKNYGTKKLEHDD